MASSSGIETSEIRVVLIGKTGVGKSTTANNLLHDKKFKTSAFADSATKRCQMGTVSFNNKKHLIIDTPGLFDTMVNEDENVNEITRCIGISSPGPHVIILVAAVGRFTIEDRNVFRKFSEIFGEMLFKFLIVVFTRKDDLIRDGKTVDQYFKSLPDEEKGFLKKCDHRYLGLNNKENEYGDRNALLQMVSGLFEKNKGDCYTHDMYDKTERILKDKMDQLKKKSTVHEENSLITVKKFGMNARKILVS